ncbi:MAG: hypothetical protein L0Z55_13320 [Planctomycetes bacterium]|nr:hypothetical protein [Planctomycetota bacterium]
MAADRFCKLAVALTTLFAVLGCAGCADLKNMQILSAGAEAWQAEIDGDVQFNVTGFTGTQVDLHDDLNMERRDDTVVYRAALGTSSFFVDARYIDLTYEGDSLLAQNITFAGQTFAVNTDVHSELDVRLVSVLGKFALFELPFVAVGGITGVDFFDLKASIQSTSPVALKASEQIEQPIPVLGLCAAAEVPLGPTLGVFADAEASGLVFKHEDVEAGYINATARGGVNVAGWLNVGAGYRLIDVDFDRDPKYEATVRVEGAFIFAEIAF